MPRPVRVALLSNVPMYYYAPLYRAIAADPRIDFTAVFAVRGGVRAGELGQVEPVEWDVDALSGFRSEFLRRADRNRLSETSFLALRGADAATRILRGRYDVLWSHGYNSLAHLLAVGAQLALGRPVLFRDDQTLLHPRPPLRAALKAALVPLLFRRAYGLYAGTENRRFLERYGIREERLFHVPHTVDNERLRAQARELAPRRAELRRELGVRDGAGPVILSVGRLVAKKQPLFLLDAFERVRRRRPCTLVYVGAGELEDEVRRAAGARRIPDVVLAGFVTQSRIARAYAAADVFALPSRLHETWGLAVNEAMSFGLPVVVSDKVGCAADLVRDGENGFVVPADDPASLAERLGRLVDDAALRARLGAESARIVADWTYDRAAAGVLAAVEAAVGPARWRAAAPARGREAVAS